jgi:hypothetical protein
MSKKIRYSLLAILSLVMIFAVFGSASAQEPVDGTVQGVQRPLHRRGGLRGEISAIEGSTITMAVAQRSVPIITTDETHFHIIGQETATLADFHVGDTILARGQRQEGDSMLASLILLQPEGDVVLGRVTEIDDYSLTINGRDQQPITITVSPDTLVAMIGQETTWDGDPAGRDLLRPGIILAAFGTASSDGLSLNAHTLVSQRPQIPHRPVAGEISAINGNEISLDLLRGQTITVVTNADTIFHIGRDNSATLADFASGDKIAILGTQDETDGSLLATHVTKRAE